MELTRRLRERVNYLTGVTQVHTLASEDWEAGAGECQDLAHLTLGGLRAIRSCPLRCRAHVVQRAEPEVGESMLGGVTPGSVLRR